MARAATGHHDAAIVDLGLPGVDGIEVVRGLRGWTSIPIIVLSARYQHAQKVEALDAGADDYVTKPFNMEELLARLRAALRRARPSEEPAAGDGSGDPRLPHRLGQQAGHRRGRPRGPADADRVASHRGAGPPSGPSGQPTPTPRGGVGSDVCGPDQLPAPVHGAAAPQARTRPVPSPVLPHRTGDGDPFRRPRERWIRSRHRERADPRSAQRVEGQVEVQDVDRLLAEEAELAAVGVRVDEAAEPCRRRGGGLAATRAACRSALATEMSGSSPEFDAVTASTGTMAPGARPLSCR